MRRLLKFLHTLGSAGLIGAAAALVVMAMQSPETMGAESYANAVHAMAQIAVWLVGPCVVLTVISGLLAMWATPAFQDAGWVWVKAATGILILLAGLHVIGPIQEEAKRHASAIASGANAESTARMLDAEVATLWVLIAVSLANIALGVWRPRLPKYPV